MPIDPTAVPILAAERSQDYASFVVHPWQWAIFV